MTIDFPDQLQTGIMVAPASGDAGGRSVPARTKTILHSVLLPNAEEWSILWKYAQLAVATKSYEGMDTVERAMQVILKGYHLGLDPIEALQQIVYTGKKMTMQAQLMISLANRSRLLKVLEIPDPKDALKQGQATVRIVRLDRPDEYIGSFSMKDAETAGLAGKTIWKLYPGAMLVNRAVSLTLRRGIPEVLGGLYLAEELEDDDSSRPSASPSTNKSSKPQIPASAATQAPSKDETVIEAPVSAEPWWKTKSLSTLVTKAIAAKYIEANQGAADLLKILDEQDWSKYSTVQDAGAAIKAAVEAMQTNNATPAPTAPVVTPAAPAAPVVETSAEPEDETVYEAIITKATYNGRTITFDLLKDGKIVVWSRGELAAMVGESFANQWQIKSWAGTAEHPGRYSFDALDLGYKKTAKGLQLVWARPSEIPF